MDNMEIFRQPKLLKKLTSTEYETLSYPEQMERLKQLRKPKRPPKQFSTSDDIPF